MARRVAKRRAPKRAPKKRARAKSKFSVTTRPIKKRYDNRFEKFYYTHRDAINRHRRAAYRASKQKRVCVKCSKKRVGKSIFCQKHLRLSRVYNRRR